MPCNSDYQDPTQKEKNYSQVLAILAELKSGVMDLNWWCGYHPEAYGKNILKESLDNLTAKACKLLSAHKDIRNLSLETQIWWRDHKKADAAREKKKQYTFSFSQINEASLTVEASSEYEAERKAIKAWENGYGKEPRIRGYEVDGEWVKWDR